MRMISKVLRKIAKALVHFIEKKSGLHVSRIHFYSPIPDVNELKDSIYDDLNPCHGIDFAVDKQLALLSGVYSQYLGEFEPSANIGLSKIDAFVLYAMIRYKKPRKYVEIGSGASTLIALKALQKNQEEGANFQFIAIEPYPAQHLKELSVENFQLYESKVQDMPLEHFQDTDMLFIDSSHVSKIGSDVNYELLNIVPNLKVGAMVHWHDIMIPGEYPRHWVVDGRLYWNESYMVHSFLLFNHSFQVSWASKYMQVKHAEELGDTFAYFQPNDPDQQLSSLWAERIA